MDQRPRGCNARCRKMESSIGNRRNYVNCQYCPTHKPLNLIWVNYLEISNSQHGRREARRRRRERCHTKLHNRIIALVFGARDTLYRRKHKKSISDVKAVRWEPTVRQARSRHCRRVHLRNRRLDFFLSKQKSGTTKDLATFKKAPMGQRQANGGT